MLEIGSCLIIIVCQAVRRLEVCYYMEYVVMSWLIVPVMRPKHHVYNKSWSLQVGGGPSMHFEEKYGAKKKPYAKIGQ